MIEIFLLNFKDLSLLFQLGVGLFQFRLLLFEAAVRFLQRPALFLEFFVGDAEFLTLHLQLFGLPLGLLQEILKASPVSGRPDGDGDRFRHAIDKLPVGFRHASKESEFQNAVDASIDGQRRDHQVARGTPSQSGADGEIPFRQVMHHDRVFVL